MPEAEQQDQQTAQTESVTTQKARSTISEVRSTISPPGTEGLPLTKESIEAIAGPLVKKIAKTIAKKTTETLLEEKLPRYTEILGVFVALFTFVSIEIQIFSRITSLGRAVIFTFLIFFCMVGFLFMLHAILNLKSGKFSAILPFLGFLFISGVAYVSISSLIKNDIPLSEEESVELQEIKEKLNKHDSDIENLKEFIQHSKK